MIFELVQLIINVLQKRGGCFRRTLSEHRLFSYFKPSNKIANIASNKLQALDGIKSRAHRKESGGHRTGRDTKYSGFWRGSQYRVHRNEHPAKWRGDQS